MESSLKELKHNVYIESHPHLLSYSTIYELYTELKKEVDSSVFSEIEAKYAGDLSRILYYFKNEKENPDYQGMHATLELQAIVLRLSRHHIKRARIIENTAQFFVDLLTSLSNEKSLNIEFTNAEFIDRPSMMVINRIDQLLRNHLEISICLVMNKSIPLLNTNCPLLTARKQLLTKMNNKIFKTISQTNFSTDSFIIFESSYNIETLNAAIIEQNFELAILIIQCALQEEEPFISRQLSYRYLGVIEANLGNYDTAIQYLNSAIQKSTHLLEKSSNTYIKALCLIKRKQNFNEAIVLIENAIEDLNNNWVEDYRYKHEKAWLINGLCLAKTIQVSKLSNQEKKQQLMSVVQAEMDAFRLINKETHFRISYLKFNLLANIAFLLEIMGEYTQAIDFWKRAFAPILREGEYYEGEKGLSYRLGVLHIKLKEYEVSSEYLKRSYQLSLIENNPFDQLAILYSLVYLTFKEGNLNLSNEYLKNGSEIAEKLRDPFYIDRFNQAIKIIEHSQKPYNEELPFPSIKLPSYVPYLDLSFIPEIDLNKTLSFRRNEK